MLKTPQDQLLPTHGTASPELSGPVAGIPVLDVERALSLLEKPEDVDHMVELLLSTVPVDLEQIEHHLHAGDRESAHRVLHQLKGFLPMFCTEAFGRELREVTLLCKHSDPSGFEQRFPAVRNQLRQLCSEAQAYLSSARS